MPSISKMNNTKKISPKILVIDVGGTHIKVGATGHRTRVKFTSGSTMTARQMAAGVIAAATIWQYDVVSIGCPGAVVQGRITVEPVNLGGGWVGFDFKKAFGRPVKIINDAAMQALGSYEGGQMLFLGLGTGLGAALVSHDGSVIPLELAHLPYKNGLTYEDYIGLRGLEHLGKRKWRKHVGIIVAKLKFAMQADYVVLGGGNSRLIEKLPPDTRLGDNSNAIRGGFRLWKKS
jgi:polyphosphate glucokinase